MNRKPWIALAVALAMLLSLVSVLSVAANPPAPDGPTPGPGNVDRVPQRTTIGKFIDQPNPKDAQRLNERWRLLEAGRTAQANALATSGTDRVLVVLAEFGGPDEITWTAPTNLADPSTGSQWDPIAKSDPNEAVTDADGNVVVGDCANIITETKGFTFSGPKHNELPRPLSAADRSGDSIWTPDFSPQWFNDFMFGNGVVFDYQRVDDSTVHEDFTGKSVAKYYEDMSAGQYHVTGDVIGWVTLSHSQMYYGADKCPGNRSGMSSGSGADGGIPGAGSPEQLVIDALKAVDAISNTIPGFNWQNYDTDGDGVIDRLWIVHAGYGEEDGPDLLNRTLPYGEGAVWSHSSEVKPLYRINKDIAAGAYIIMPENGGIGVFSHESGHNLGAQDLYAYNEGETSAGFWTLMADDWTGYPIGFEPPAVDPYHLDRWGWLNPLVISDTTKTHEFTLGQASAFPGGEGVYRGARIELPDGHAPLAVKPVGQYQWWGGKADKANSRMTLKQAVALPAGKPATLSFDLSYYTEAEWDFFWVQASTDGGTTWETLTNANTTCAHVPSWIGGEWFPDDLCAAGIGGFTGEGASFPDYANQAFDLSKYAGENVQVRLWYMTDWGTTYDGVFVDNVKIDADGSTLFSDDAETAASDAKWTYERDWARNDGNKWYTQNYYLQWRNVGEDGGYDSALGDSRWRFGPANTGLLMWYNNNAYTDNEVFNYLTDYPAFGPKGRMLVVDAHPEPYRDPYWMAGGYDNEGANLTSRMQMRDAPFSKLPSVGFTVKAPYAFETTDFLGRGAAGRFDDAFGYYPGAELMPGGPIGQTTPRWMTKQWDASVVLPSTAFYGIKAPGYNGTDRLRFGCSRNAAGQVLCYSYPSGVGYPGSNGNPGDVDGAYGWHVQILSQTSKTTKVRVWNSHYTTPAYLTTDKATAKSGEVVTYAFDLHDSSIPQILWACAPVETGKSTYVDQSVTGGAVPLPMSCGTAANALAANQTVRDLASQAGPVQSIMWKQDLAVGADASFSFQVKPTLVKGLLNPTVQLYNSAGDPWKDLSASAVQVVPTSEFFFPLIHKR